MGLPLCGPRTAASDDSASRRIRRSRFWFEAMRWSRGTGKRLRDLVGDIVRAPMRIVDYQAGAVRKRFRQPFLGQQVLDDPGVAQLAKS